MEEVKDDDAASKASIGDAQLMEDDPLDSLGRGLDLDVAPPPKKERCGMCSFSVRRRGGRASSPYSLSPSCLYADRAGCARHRRLTGS